jgi:hypothetical protein
MPGIKLEPPALSKVFGLFINSGLFERNQRWKYKNRGKICFGPKKSFGFEIPY